MCCAGGSTSTPTARCARPRTRTATPFTSYSHHGLIERLTVSAAGEVETSDAAGVVRGAVERLPAEMYLRDSPLAHVNGALRGFAAEATTGAADPLDSMHRLMSALNEVIAFQPDEKDAAGSAVEAFALRRGRARDFAHIFIACARFLGVPARFVSGYRVGGRGLGARRARMNGRRPMFRTSAGSPSTRPRRSAPTSAISASRSASTARTAR